MDTAFLGQDPGRAVKGSAWCHHHSRSVDEWLGGLFRTATASSDDDLALVAVGGYGRAELCPGSDIDVVLVHTGRSDIQSLAERIWYPVWDSGVHLGHRVATVGESLDLARDDLDTATALLSARLVSGSSALADELRNGARRRWARRGSHWLRELASSTQRRHAQAGDVAFLLEPDLKEGRGGLRDVHALEWAAVAEDHVRPSDRAALAASYEVVLRARVELHRVTGRTGNVMVLEEQPGVARALGYSNTDALMRAISSAASTISWISDDTWRGTLARRAPRRSGRRGRSAATSGVVVTNDRAGLDPANDSRQEDPDLALRLALCAAQHDVPIDRDALEQVASAHPGVPAPWQASTRELLVNLLLTGRAALGPISALDFAGLWEIYLPEWAAIRARPQHNSIHRFTVDRHLLETAARAAAMAERTSRADLLVLGALLHDIGKGSGTDHTSAGMALVQSIAERMGYAPEDIETLVAMVEHHLLLPEVATRRDLSDPDLIESVAAAVKTVDRLRLLRILSEADAGATSPTAWSRWKAELLDLLVERTEIVLSGQGGSPVAEPFPTDAHWLLWEQPGQVISVDDDRLTVVSSDRPGLFSRVAGALALHGLDIEAAAAHSARGRALAEFRVSERKRFDVDWDAVIADVEGALAGRLALSARLAEKARTYGRGRPAAARVARTAVRIHNDASLTATVIDVYAPDRIGVLYRITRAMADLDLDIRSARIETIEHQLVDAFYVVDALQEKVTDSTRLREIERALLHAIEEAG